MGGEVNERNDTADTLAELVESLLQLSNENKKLSVHRLREEVGERSFGPFLLVFAIIEISPIGGIPVFPH